MENQWNANNFQTFAPQPNNMPQPLPKSLEELKPPSTKRPRAESESTEEDEENYSTSPSPASNTSNVFNNPGPIAHSTPLMPLMPQNQQLQPMQPQQQQMQQTDFSNFTHPMMQQQWAAQMNPLMQQQWAATQMLQQQQQSNGYPLQQQQQQHSQNMYNLQNLNNTQTSTSSCENDDSGNSSIIQQPPQQNLNLPPNEIEFCAIPGRLALLSQNKKVRVTLAEIQRRIAAPECLNASLLSAILRKAKNREGGKVLSNDLAKHNISLAAGRRKSAPNTAFTALVESDALTLAKDFHELSDKHFPFNDIAYEFIKTIHSMDDWHSCMLVIYNYVGYTQTFGVFQRLMSILSSDNSPVAERPLNLPLLMDAESQKNFTHFCLITHGFGTPAHLSSWNTQQKVFKVLPELAKNKKEGATRENTLPKSLIFSCCAFFMSYVVIFAPSLLVRVFEAMTNPKTFCTKIARAIPPGIDSIEPLISMYQQQQQQRQNQALQLQQQQQNQALHLQQSGYPAQ
uniref:Transcription factor AP-2 C-terminal domain-containing protein n=1 Tax=Panagrolaimus davidi TaxID=227884 RepID=A0A914QMK6_9BILA